MANRRRVERFEDGPELFGVGVGSSSDNGVDCEWCGVKWPADSSTSVCFTRFGGKQICDCCFGEIEQAVLERMQDILPWFTRLLEARRTKLAGNDAAVDALIRMADGVAAARNPPVKAPRA